jgi:hypothetical protein
LCEICLMSTEPVISLDHTKDWSVADWYLGIEVNGVTVLVFDELIDSEFNIHFLDRYLTMLKESLDTQNSDGQLRLRYNNGA